MPLEQTVVAVLLFRIAYYAVPFLVSVAFFRTMLRVARGQAEELIAFTGRRGRAMGRSMGRTMTSPTGKATTSRIRRRQRRAHLRAARSLGSLHSTRASRARK